MPRSNQLFRRGQRGSLLLEALLSVVILSVSIALIIQSMTSAMRASVYSKDATLAILKLDNLLTEFKSGSSVQQEQSQDDPFILSSVESTEDHIKRLDASVRWKAGAKHQSILVSSYAYATDK